MGSSLGSYSKSVQVVLENDCRSDIQGIRVQAAGPKLFSERQKVLNHLRWLGLDQFVSVGTQAVEAAPAIRFSLRASLADKWAPEWDTTRLCQQLNLETEKNTDDLEREIFLAMLLSPVPFDFPSHEELASAIRVRKSIVTAARRTSLAFDTRSAERPEDCWTYSEENGFTILPGSTLINALQKATQPGASGKLYSFSCYRATEYVILLAIAQELEVCNPALLGKLQLQWERRAIKSAEFHDVFLREYGTEDAPLPLRYFVPGDRTWFRNPDDHSSDVSGYEGSWVFYLGNSQFSNFWELNRPFTLTSKCVELFHWRNAVRRNPEGELYIDERSVAERVRQSLSDTGETEAILRVMMRHREPAGVYVDGGSIDNTREYPRMLCVNTSDLKLPADFSLRPVL